jgi:hypothetical protein
MPVYVCVCVCVCVCLFIYMHCHITKIVIFIFSETSSVLDKTVDSVRQWTLTSYPIWRRCEKCVILRWIAFVSALHCQKQYLPAVTLVPTMSTRTRNLWSCNMMGFSQARKLLNRAEECVCYAEWSPVLVREEQRGLLWRHNTAYMTNTVPSMYCLLTQSLEQSPSWEANVFSASQVIPHFYGTRRIYYCFHKSPPLCFVYFY